jgi:hypothetical protein
MTLLVMIGFGFLIQLTSSSTLKPLSASRAFRTFPARRNPADIALHSH